MAMACLRLVTFPPFPRFPERSVPRFLRRIVLPTVLLVARLYFLLPAFFPLELRLVGMLSLLRY